jgi:hypothetical protein
MKRKASEQLPLESHFKKRKASEQLPLESHFKHPFTSIIAGPTGCGKSSWINKLLNNQRKIIPRPEKIYWCYSEWQSLYEKVYGVEFVEGLLDVDKLDKKICNLIIIDDLMGEKDESLTNLFTKGSHHRNTSVLYITQNIFEQHKDSRTISLNAQYMIAFKNPRDPSQINHLAKQIFPSNSEYMLDAFLKATRNEYGYLFIDLTQTTPDDYRLRTSVFGRPGCPLKTEVLYEPIKRRRLK